MPTCFTGFMGCMFSLLLSSAGESYAHGAQGDRYHCYCMQLPLASAQKGQISGHIGPLSCPQGNQTLSCGMTCPATTPVSSLAKTQT